MSSALGPARSPLRVVAVACVSFLVSVVAVLPAHALQPRLPNGVAAVLDPVTLDRVGTLGPGETAFFHVVVQELDTGAGDGLRGVQFGLQIDPRLQVVGKFPDSGLFLDFEVEPDEWVMTFSQCVSASSTPQRVLTYQVSLAPGVTDLTDLRVEVVDLAVYGEPILFQHCTVSNWTQRAPAAGGVVFNPSAPSIAYLAASTDWAVEGRDYELAWEVDGASAVTLDGSPVAAISEQAVPATVTTDHLLEAQGAGGTVSATRRVEVIREPKVLDFQAVLDESGASPVVKLNWDVVGADTVELVGVGPVFPRGRRVEAVSAQQAWELRATNEWGTTSVVAELPGLADQPPFILDFTGSPQPFVRGEPLQLSWRTLNADVVRIDPEVGTVATPDGGIAPVHPLDDTTYTLTATNAFGERTATYAARLGPPVVKRFDVVPASFAPGDTITIVWELRGAEEAFLDPGFGSVAPDSGRVRQVFSETTRLDLTARNRAGDIVVSRVVTLIPPQILDFRAEPLFVFPRALTRLQWNVSAGLDVRIEPVPGPLENNLGSVLVPVDVDSMVFTLYAASPGTTLVATAGPVQWTPPSVTLTASELNPPGGTPVTLTAQIFGADTARLDPIVGPIDPSGGTFEVSVQEPTTFVLRATNDKGTREASVTITPIPRTPTLSLAANPPNPFGGAPYTLVATVADADSAALEPGIGPIPPTGGSFEQVAPGQPVTWTLRAWNYWGEASTELVVTPRPPVARLTLLTPTVFPGDAAVLDVFLDGEISATLDPVFGPVTSGRYQFRPNQTTTLVLTATNPVGSTVDQVTVVVRPPVVPGFSVTPAEIVPGESAELSWSVVGADSVGITGSDGSVFEALAAVGTLSVQPASSVRYDIHAFNRSGETQRSVDLSVVPIRIVRFEADPDFVVNGQSSTLSWEVVGTGDVELTGFGAQPLAGDLVVTPTGTTSYTLVASSGAFRQSRSVTVHVFGSGQNLLQWSWSPSNPDLPPDQGVLPFVPFHVYVVLSGTAGGILGYEFQAVVPPDVLILSAVPQPQSALNFGDAPGEFIVGTGVCLPDQELTLLVDLTLMALSEQGIFQELLLSGTTPSSFPDGAPGYLTCGRVLVPAQVGPPFPLWQGADPTPVELLSLDVTSRDGGGAELRWRSEDLDSMQGGSILRRRSDALPELIHTLDAAAAREGRWVDDSVGAGDDVRYRVILDGPGGPRSSPEVAPSEDTPPSGRVYARDTLLPNQPNPFNPSTEIRFHLVQPGRASLEIYDPSGRRVRTVDLGSRIAGDGSWTWLGSDDRGVQVSSGVYLVRLITEHGRDTRRIVLLK